MAIDLVDPKVVATEAEKKEFEKRKTAFFKEIEKIELKYSLRFGAEIRGNPVSIYAQLVVIDLKKVRKPLPSKKVLN